MVRTLILMALLAIEPADPQPPRLTPYAGPIHAQLVEDVVAGRVRLSLVLEAQQPAGCGELAVSEARAGRSLTITVDGIRRDGPRAALSCLMKEPLPPSASIELPNETGRHTLMVKSAG